MPKPVEDIRSVNLRPELEMALEHLWSLQSAIDFVNTTQAHLDGLADGDFAPPPTNHFRDAQENLIEAAELLESEMAVVESRIEAIEARIEEEND